MTIRTRWTTAVAAACLMTGGCATTGVRLTLAQAEARLTAAEARYAQVHRLAVFFLPYMPAAWQDRVRAADAAVATALAAARAATTIAVQARAIERAGTLTDNLAQIAGA